MTEIIPAILENNFSEIEKKIHIVEGLVEWIQIDLLDGTLMPNTTFADPNPFATFQTPVKLELHLMVKDPLRYLSRFAKAGFKRFFAHVEGDYVDEYIEECNRLGVEVGLAIDGPTDFDLPAGRQEKSLHQYMDNLDAVLVMAIDAGFSGRPFREDTIEKIRKIRKVDFEIPIAVDGAMNDVNAEKVIKAGATRINSNSYIFNSEDVKIAIEKLRNIDVIASEAKQSVIINDSI